MAIAYKLGRATRAIWNGPFYIGKLAQPASLGDVLLKFLETIWRTIVALTLLVGIGLAIGGLWAQLLAPLIFPPLKEQIVATAAYDVEGVTPPPIVATSKGAGKPFRCSVRYPLKVGFENQSSSTIGKISFAVEARIAGRSSNLADWSGSNYETDVIIKPGYRIDQCWVAPLTRADLDRSLLRYSVIISGAYPESDNKNALGQP